MNRNRARDQRRGGRETDAIRRRRRCALGLEWLEGRVVPAIYTVTGLADAAGAVTDLGSGNFSATTLRAAINAANADTASDTIQFDPNLTATESATINLSILGNNSQGGTAFDISTPITIEGPTGDHGITIARDPSPSTPRLRQFRVLSGGNLNLQNLTLSGGAPGSTGFDGAGGQFYVYGGGVVSITNSTLTGGFTTFGGAINNQGGTLTLTNSTLSGNAADLSTGGAINNYSGGEVTLVNCTVSNNSARGNGGGINNQAGTLNLTNTIVAGNTPNNVFGAFSGTGNLTSGDPLLAPLGNYGGPTQTMALLFGSPAIDAGVAVTGVTTDQRGTARDANPDIGAFEVAAATHFAVTGFPSPITAGNAGTFTVTALDADGNVATDYTGTVQFTSSDPQATLPSDYTFTSVSGGDNGRHTFTNSATLKTAGTQSITATDTTTASITGTEFPITVTPATASKLEFGQQPTNATAGEAISPAVTVKVEDTYGNVVTSNSSTVTLTLSNGTTATAVASSGVATFSTLKFDTAGTYIIVSATADSLTGSGMSNSFLIFPAAASQLVITQQPSSTATAGVAFATQPVVTAKDRFGNVVTNDSTHTVTAASTGTASLQGTTTVTLVNGVATFSGLSYNKAETIALQFTTNAGSFSATSNNVVVSPAVATHLFLSVFPTPVSNGSPFSLTVQARDEFDNIATGFRDTVKFTSTDGGAVLPGRYTFTAADGGAHTFMGLILRKKGKQTITAFITAPPKDSAITGSIDINVT